MTIKEEAKKEMEQLKRERAIKATIVLLECRALLKNERDLLKQAITDIEEEKYDKVRGNKQLYDALANLGKRIEI